jgi:SAM-dependent methyltransferase
MIRSYNNLRRFYSFINHFGFSLFLGKFRIYKRHCSNCEKNTFFISTGNELYKKRCLSCRATVISISVIYAIKNKNINFDATYELSSYGVVFDFLKRKSKNFYFSEYFGDKIKSKRVNGVRNEDVQNLTFNNNYFTLVTSTEVFEHVPNYMRGLAEVYRVLRIGGHFVFTVPLFNGSTTIQVARLSNNKITWLLEPEFHGSRISGLNTVPVFWRHSKKQIIQDLLSIGFKSAELLKSRMYKSQLVIIAIK